MSLTLLQRAARGDQDAVPACLAEYGSLVWALARRHASDPADAEDAAQDIFIDLWRHAGRFDPTVAAESTFVAMIARRRLMDRSRKRGRSISANALPEDGGPVNPPAADMVAIADEVAVVRERMAEISPEQRTVLEMAIDGDMPQAEIAASLGMPLGTVKAHARRGLLRLRELLTAKTVGPLEGGGVR